MKNFLLFALCLMLVCCTKKEEKAKNIFVSEAVPEKAASNTACQTSCGTFDQKICDTLFQEYEKCNNKKVESDCKGFVAAFAKALPKTVECTNTCSKESFKMSISYNCDEIDKSGYPKITERSSHLLSKLKFNTAVDLFLSDEFYAILDGALAEDMMPEIKKAKKRQ